MSSRAIIALEKYVKQVSIEAETMTAMARQLFIPAATQHQTQMAEAVASTMAADVDCEEQRQELTEFVGKVSRLKAATRNLETALEHHDEDPMAHA
ncbi:MAG: glutamine synthetase type III, partial [bacterium]